MTLAAQNEALLDRQPSPIEFSGLRPQRERVRPQVEAGIQRVLEHGRFIMGPEIGELESQLAARVGGGHVVTCASGTDALLLALLARRVGAGDAVFVPAFTFVATAEVVALAGATPVFVDVTGSDFLIDPESLAAAIDDARRNGLRPRAVIPVDLFGQPADYAAIAPIAAAGGAWVLADAAQSFGASRDGGFVGTLASMTATSFFPAKPLGCYGDGGALFTDDAETAAVLRSLRVHGQGENKYDARRIGMNGRLDTLQAAILLAKLTVFDDEIVARRRVAARYDDGLCGLVERPTVAPGADPVWAQYTIRVPQRDRLVARLKAEGIPIAIYYPKALHQQAAYGHCPMAPSGLPVSERLVAEVLSLPMHPYLEAPVQERIVEAVRASL
jgi:dTDP-4-amino-4,6-dideoxygalactose transaminase